MPYAEYTELVRPGRNGAKFDGRWRIIGGDNFKWTDVVWFLNGEQMYSHPGGSGSKESDDVDITRADWWPYNTSRRLTRVRYDVRGANEDGGWGEFRSSPDLEIGAPPAPAVELSASGTSMTAKFTAEADSAERERAYTGFAVSYRRNSGSGPIQALRAEEVAAASASWSITEQNTPAWAGVASGLTSDQWVEVTAEAVSRGLAGDSPRASAAYVFAWPARAQITRVELVGSESTGTVMVSISPNASRYHPVDTVQLQRATGSYQTAADIPSASWSNVSGASGSGYATCLCDQAADAVPPRGSRTWYRIVSTHGSYTQVSEAMALGIFKPNPVTGAAHIISAESGDDGTSVCVDIGWPAETGTGVERFTRVAWGGSEHAWESTKAPSESDFAWQDATPSSQSYAATARVYITDLEEGSPVYIRARRGYKDGSATTLGEWSSIAVVTPVSTPASVVLDAPSSIARGDDLELTWNIGSDQTQTSWYLSEFDKTTGTDTGIWARGDDALGAAVIAADSLEGVDELTLRVHASTGGAFAVSDPVTVVIADAPECGVSCDGTVEAQGPEISLATDTEGATVVISVVAEGVSYARPDGNRTQYPGDVVYAASLTPSWEEDDGAFAAMVELPPDLALVNGGGYTVRAVVIDPATGLSSPMATDGFSVAWSHLADAPGCTVSADRPTLSASMTVDAPPGVAAGDVCDVYRVTPDGADLIASGVAFGSIVTDRFAPFSGYGSGVGTSYRIACRTADGDVAWADAAYSLEAYGLVLDWANSRVELPYDPDLDESISKPFDKRDHLDGTATGQWGPGTSHSGSFSTNLILIRSDAESRLVREMARHLGAVFVRAGNGIAFDADVQLGRIAESHDSAARAVSLDITRIDLTTEHMCGERDIDGGESE